MNSDDSYLTKSQASMILGSSENHVSKAQLINKLHRLSFSLEEKQAIFFGIRDMLKEGTKAEEISTHMIEAINEILQSKVDAIIDDLEGNTGGSNVKSPIFRRVG